MTSEGLGEVFEGDFAPKFFAGVDWGPSRVSSVHRPGSKDQAPAEIYIYVSTRLQVCGSLYIYREPQT